MKARERHMWSQLTPSIGCGTFNKQSELRGPMDILILKRRCWSTHFVLRLVYNYAQIEENKILYCTRVWHILIIVVE